ncbi:MAG: peptidoglycan DD-metalloendopeptidase family protein [Candidatus Uhrbacteria bacterium]|nr:peptidoglycan DD-metalloendopeptidase family protein [Candidatus Uhrbacteria bacterium]
MRLIRIFLSLIFALTLTTQPLLSYAQTSTEETEAANGGLKREIDQLNGQVRDKEKRVQELDSLIGKYKSRIKEYEAAVGSLQNQVALLENRIEEKQFAVERTKNQIEVTGLQIQSLGNQIRIEQARVERRQASLAALIRKIHEADMVTTFDVILTRPSLSEFFSRLEELKRVEYELVDATKAVKETKKQLEGHKARLESERLALQNQKQALQKEQDGLEGDRSAKVSLITETQNKDEEFQRILHELRQEQQSTADRLANLQDRLKDKLDSIDTALARGDVLLNWPLRALKGISAHFHDPTYPFRRLFEHPGVDVPTGVGTPVRAAAGGYVAWNKRGKQYGNYVMLVHPGGIATVYAHLTRFGASPDSYVERGDIIGYSGGRPGDPGAGLSTGPHLHFEVRQNGIPVNPENFLASLE